jgi:hypothetical protein
MRRAALLVLVSAVVVFGIAAIVHATRAPSSVSRFIACIERRGWRRVRRPFTIKDQRSLDLGSGWEGGPGSYVEVFARRPHKRFDMVVVSEKLGVADQESLLQEAQSDPSGFEAVLISEHPPPGEAASRPDADECSYKVYPNQGP